MQPTYSFLEIKELVRNIDFLSIDILQELIEEEQACYSSYEQRAFKRFLSLKSRAFINNELNSEFLLSYN